jgi:hypothetical protein
MAPATAAAARRTGALPDSLSQDRTRASPPRPLPRRETLSATCTAVRCWSGSITSETEKASSPLASRTATALIPGGSVSKLTPAHDGTRASGPAIRQMAVHHSRGSPSPPITAMTLAPATSRRTGKSSSRDSRAAVTSAFGIGTEGTASAACEIVLAVITWRVACAWSMTAMATTPSSRRWRRFAPRTFVVPPAGLCLQFRLKQLLRVHLGLI